MQLGTLIGNLSLENDAAVALEGLGDLVLFAKVQAMGERYEETPGEYVANAVRRFAARAGDEDWLGLMTVMERSEDPARAALEQMLRWALKTDAEKSNSPSHTGCTCGSGSAHDHPS